MVTLFEILISMIHDKKNFEKLIDKFINDIDFYQKDNNNKTLIDYMSEYKYEDLIEKYKLKDSNEEILEKCLSKLSDEELIELKNNIYYKLNKNTLKP